MVTRQAGFRQSCGDVRELGRAVKVPVFTGHDEVFADLGIGGRITSGRESGRLAATLALKRIAAPDAAPELVGTPMVHRARPVELRRWNIPESLLPADTVLEVRPSETFGGLGPQSMAGSALIAGLAVAVALLARSNHIRRETVRRLSESESICSPNALCVLVIRATRPSRLSSTMAQKIPIAACMNWPFTAMTMP
jgi:hypothetical protein